MSGARRRAWGALAGVLLAVPHFAAAHVVCGDRVFPATLTMDDPGVGDEFSFPTIQYTPIPASGGTPRGDQVDYGFEWDKTITEHLGFALNGDYLTQRGAGANAAGWDNITLTLKDEFACDGPNEFAASFGVVRQFARTGSSLLIHQGLIDDVGNTAPTFYVGKGLGDILPGYLRPLALTGEAGYAFSDSPGAQPNEWDYSVSVQYSIPYLQEHVKDVGLPSAIGHLVPLVEFGFSSPHGQPTTGTAAPGLLYEGDTWQLGAEAIIPINTATSSGQGVGFIVQFHLFLDDIFPDSLGKPLIRG